MRGSATDPRLQILTIADLLASKLPELPSAHVTYKAAERVKPGPEQMSLFDQAEA